MKKPSIPSIPLDAVNKEILGPLKEAVEIITGQRGEKIKPLSIQAQLPEVISKLNLIIRTLQNVAPVELSAEDLIPASTDQEPATLAQLRAALEGLAQKDNVRTATQGNINLASPGATIDGINMVSGDRVLVKAQTANTENGVYVWNGAATPMTRSLDANTFDELESALVPVDEGTNAGTVWRQTAINGVLGNNAVLFVAFGTAGVQATEASAGVLEIATQAETDAGTDDLRAITPLKLASSAFATKKFNQTIGDGSATSYVVTHNLNTRDVLVEVVETAGTFRTVLVEVQRTSVNSVTVLFDTPPASNAYRALIRT